MDEEDGEGSCADSLTHYKSAYGIDGCASLWCATCTLSGKCDATCGLCECDETDSTASDEQKEAVGEESVTRQEETVDSQTESSESSAASTL